MVGQIDLEVSTIHFRLLSVHFLLGRVWTILWPLSFTALIPSRCSYSDSYLGDCLKGVLQRDPRNPTSAL